MQRQCGLLLDRLDGDEAHGRSGDCLADRLRITRISLAPLNVGLDVGRRHQPNLVSETDQLSRPMMARAAGFHADETRRGDNTNFASGAQIGFNTQFGSTVIGVEADLTYGGVSRREISFGALNEPNIFRQDLDWLGTARARAGVAF